MTILNGKTALIVGVASKKSIAYGIAESLHKQGAKLAFTYQNEKLRPRVEDIANTFGSKVVIPCDVSSDQDISKLRIELEKSFCELDILIHSVGFAPSHELNGDMVDVATREGFKIAHDISSFSLIALTQSLKPIINDGGSIITLTYHGSTQTLPNYNVMGLAKASLEAGVRYLAKDLGKHNIRVNSISAGPIRTLAASGIKNFRSMLKHHETRAPLKRNVTIEEVGNTAMFLASPLASGITGENIYVDAGFRSSSIADADL